MTVEARNIATLVSHKTPQQMLHKHLYITLFTTNSLPYQNDENKMVPQSI